MIVGLQRGLLLILYNDLCSPFMYYVCRLGLEPFMLVCGLEGMDLA